MRLPAPRTSQPHPFLTLPRAGALAALLLASLVPIPSPALDVRPGDIVTATTRLDPASSRMDALAPIQPLGLAADGDFLYALSTGASSNGIVRKVWQYQRSTGRHSLLATTTMPNSFVLAPNLVAKGAGSELFIILGGSVSRLDGFLAIDTVTGAQREIPIAAFGSIFTQDLVVTPLGSLVALRGSGGVTLLTPAGDRIESPAGSAAIRAVAITPDGRLIGMAPDGRQDAVAASQLFSIDPDTAALTLLATLPGLGIRSVSPRLAAARDGHYYTFSQLGNSEFVLHRIHGATFERTVIPLDPSVRLDSVSDLDADPLGGLLLTAKDTSLQSQSHPSALAQTVFHIDPDTGITRPILGNRMIPTGIVQITAGDQADLYFTTGDTGRRDRVFRQDLITGVVSLVTSREVPGGVMTDARQLAYANGFLYVIDEVPVQENRLVRVDVQTGAQTLLTSLGARLFPRHLTFDPVSGDLFLSAWGGHTSGCCGSIVRVRPEPGAIPVQVTQTGYLGNPEGLRVDAAGDIFVVGSSTDQRGIYRVHPDTGEQSVVTEDPSMIRPFFIEFTDHGDLLIGDLGHTTVATAAIFRWHPGTGELTRVIGIEDTSREQQNGFTMLDLVRIPPFSSGPAVPVPAALVASPAAEGSLRLAWDDPDGTWQLVSAPEVPSETWTPVPGAVAIDPPGTWVIDIDPDDPAQFFRLRLDDPPPAPGSDG